MVRSGTRAFIAWHALIFFSSSIKCVNQEGGAGYRVCTCDIASIVNFVTAQRNETCFTSIRFLKCWERQRFRYRNTFLFGNHVNNKSFLDISNHHRHVFEHVLPFRYILAVLFLWPVCCASFPFEKFHLRLRSKVFLNASVYSLACSTAGMFFFSSNKFLTKEGGYRVSFTCDIALWESYRHQLSHGTEHGWPRLCEAPWRHLS